MDFPFGFLLDDMLDLFCYLVHTIIFWLRLWINFINLIQFHGIENTFFSCNYIHLCSLEIQVSSKDFIHVLLSHETRNLINENCLGFFATLIITASSLKFFWSPLGLYISLNDSIASWPEFIFK